MRHLSEEWLRAANDAAVAAASDAPDGRIVIDQHVGDLGYRVCIERNACSITALRPGSDIGADARFRQSEATADAVVTGETDAHQAFLLGKIRFEGDIDLVIERRDAFDWLESTLAPVMAQTTFD